MKSSSSSSTSLLPGLKTNGFTLVEIVMALGVVAFAMVGMMGLLPVGLATQREAMSNMVQSHIVQALTNEILLSDFSSSTTSTTCYYDNEGRKVSNADAAVYTATVTLDTLGPDSILQFQATSGSSSDVYNARITVSSPNRPSQTNKYSVIVAKPTL